MRKRFGVIVAAGRGSWRKVTEGVPMPKVLETIGNRPIIEHAVRAMQGVRNLEGMVVVINPINGHLIKEFLKPFDVEFAIQPDRLGAADAVKYAILHLFGTIDLRLRQHDFACIFADMPFWTTRTIEQLLNSHQKEGALMTMGTVRLENWKDPRLSRLQKYGRVIKDDDGCIQYCVEPKVASSDEAASPWISPSLYAFDTGWFSGKTTRRSEKDLDFKDEWALKLNQAEFHLPAFARFAAEEKRIEVENGKVRYIPNPLEFPIMNPYEALGVNTAEELKEADGLWSEMIDIGRKQRRG